MKRLKITSSERALSIIKSPIMTEKSTNLNQFNKYSFFVTKNSNTQEIKQAIESIFKVKVIKVNTLINRGKLKSFKGSLGYKKDQKKWFGENCIDKGTLQGYEEYGANQFWSDVKSIIVDKKDAKSLKGYTQ